MAREDTYIKTAGITPAKEENNILLGTIPFEGNEFLSNLFEKVRARKEQGLDPNPYLVDRGQVNWIFDKFQYQDNVVVVGVTNPVGIAQYDDYYRQVVILVDGKISAKIHKGWKNTGHSVEILDNNYQFIIKLIGLDELVEVHGSERNKWAVPVYRAKNDDLVIDYIPSSGLIWSSDRLLSQTLSTILELYWKDLDWSKPFQWAIVGSKHYNTEFFLFGSRNSVMAINKCHNIILLFINGELLIRGLDNPRWFHEETNIEEWIKGLPEEEEDIKKYIPAEVWDECESLDYVREFISCIELYRKPSPRSTKGDLTESNSLPTSRLRPEEYSDSVFNLLARGTGKDSYETPFSWGTDMQGKILVSSNAFVKEEWADKVVFFRETFRKQAPDERSFYKGNLNVEDILEKGSPIVYSMEINGKPSFGECSVYTRGGYIYVDVPSFGKVILSNDSYNKEAYGLPKIDWVRTYQVNKDLTVAGLLAGRFYFWMKGDNSDNDRHSLVKTSVWMADYLSTK